MLPKIAIVIGTTREGRFADTPAQWMLEQARARGDAEYEIIDLRDYPMPLFDEPRSPMWEAPRNETAQRWGRKVAEFDGYIFITAEYNHSVSGALKNALDYTYAGFNRKPAAFVGYGSVGGARAVEQLRLILIELQVAPIRNAVHIGSTEYIGVLRQGKTFSDFPNLIKSAGLLLDELSWWTRALKAGRESRAEADAVKS